MKKCLCTFFICLFIFILNTSVYAYCEEKENKSLEVNYFYKYKYYRNEEIFKYFKKNQNTSDYKVLIENDIKYTDYSAWSFTKEEKEDRIFEERDVYIYKKIKPIKYLYLDGFKGGNERLYISEIMLFDNGEEIPFEVECENCSKDFDKYIMNKDLYEDNSYVNSNSTLKIKLLNEKPFEDIEFHISLYDTTDIEKSFNIKVLQTNDINNRYSSASMYYYFKNNSVYDIEDRYFRISDFVLENPIYDEIISLEELNDKDLIFKEMKKQYRYKDILYKYVGNKKIYSSDYLEKETDEFPIKDENIKKKYEMCIWKDLDTKEEIIDIKEETQKNRDNKIIKTNNIQYTKGYEKIKNANCTLEKQNISELNKDLLKCKNDKNIYFYILLIICIFLLLYNICQKKKKKKKN